MEVISFIVPEPLLRPFGFENRDRLSGNRHNLHIFDEAMEDVAELLNHEQVFIRASFGLYNSCDNEGNNAPVQVFLSIHKGVFGVKFFQYGHEIRRCGSGSLVCAWYIKQYLGIDSARLMTIDGDVCVGVHNTQVSAKLISKNMDKNVLLGGRESATVDQLLVGKKSKKLEYYYQAQPLKISTKFTAQEIEKNTIVTNLHSWREILDKEVADFFLIGNERDYAVIVLGSERDVRLCKINYQTLCSLTNRALIVTSPVVNMSGGALDGARARAAQSTVDYAMRYFAPQYGQDEDSATGSANLHIAQYWMALLSKDSVTGVQLSYAGGYFHLTKYDSSVRISGYVSVRT